MLVVRTLPANVQEGIVALFRAVCQIRRHYGPLTDLEGDAKLILLTAATFIPSYHSHPASIDILRFIASHSVAHGVASLSIVSFFPWHVILAPTVRPRKIFFVSG